MAICIVKKSFLVIPIILVSALACYAIFPAPDFFSDRALKAVSAIHFLIH